MTSYFGFAQELLAKGMAQEEDAYGADNLYDLTMCFNEDISFYQRLARQRPGRVLDIGCGSGRVMLPLLEDGVDVVGLDNSPEMLRRCRERLAAWGHQAQLVEGDMRAFRIPGLFDLVIIPFFSMIYMQNDADRLALLRCVHSHLHTDGLLGFDFHAGEVPLGDSLPWLGLQGIDPRAGAILVQVVQSRGLRLDLRLINQVNYRITPEKTSISVQAVCEAVVPVERMRSLLMRAGFCSLQFFADYQQTPYTRGEPCVVQAEKSPLQ